MEPRAWDVSPLGAQGSGSGPRDTGPLTSPVGVQLLAPLPGGRHGEGAERGRDKD